MIRPGLSWLAYVVSWWLMALGAMALLSGDAMHASNLRHFGGPEDHVWTGALLVAVGAAGYWTSLVRNGGWARNDWTLALLLLQLWILIFIAWGTVDTLWTGLTSTGEPFSFARLGAVLFLTPLLTLGYVGFVFEQIIRESDLWTWNSSRYRRWLRFSRFLSRTSGIDAARGRRRGNAAARRRPG